MRASWLSEHFALNLQGSYVVDPDDNKDWRADGSYIGVNFGNFMLSAGFMERWWGPGWDGSLILSTNARPIPSITLERNYTDPFKTRLLSWMGPWRASIAMGEAESHDVAVPNVKFFAARLNFRPRPWLEFGLTRTAQWCGGDRPCDWDTFVDMVLGNDNRSRAATRMTSPATRWPGTTCACAPLEAIAAGLLYPMDRRGRGRRPAVQVHRSIRAGDLGIGGVRHLAPAQRILGYGLHISRARRRNSTAPTGTRIYPQGYAYRGRIIGHSMDNDSRMFTLAGLLTRAERRCPEPHAAPGEAQSRRRRTCHQRRAPRPRQCRIALLAGGRRRQAQRRRRVPKIRPLRRIPTLRRPWFR